MGALLSRVRFSDDQASNNLFGNVTFSNRFTGHPYADFLLGIPTTAARAFPPIRIDRTRWSYDLFVADDFKVRPNLTINAGLRYELHPAWAEETGQQALFDVETGTTTKRIALADKPAGWIQCLAFSPDQSKLAWGEIADSLHVPDVQLQPIRDRTERFRVEVAGSACHMAAKFIREFT